MFGKTRFYHPGRALWISTPQDPQAFSHAIRRVTHDAVKQPPPPALPAATKRKTAQGGVGQVAREDVAQPALEPVEAEVAPQRLLAAHGAALGLGAGVVAAAAHGAAVDVAAPAGGAEGGAGDGEGARAGEGVVEELPGRGEGHVGRHERELAVHGGGGDVGPLLQVEAPDEVAGAAGEEAAKVQAGGGRPALLLFLLLLLLLRLAVPGVVRGMLLVSVGRVKGPLLEDDVLLVRVLHADGPPQRQVAEGVDEVAALGGATGALEGIDVELPRVVGMGLPQVRRGLLDRGVQLFEGGPAAPELVDGLREDGAADEAGGGGGGGCADEAEGGGRGVRDDADGDALDLGESLQLWHSEGLVQLTETDKEIHIERRNVERKEVCVRVSNEVFVGI